MSQLTYSTSINAFTVCGFNLSVFAWLSWADDLLEMLAHEAEDCGQREEQRVYDRAGLEVLRLLEEQVKGV